MKPLVRVIEARKHAHRSVNCMYGTSVMPWLYRRAVGEKLVTSRMASLIGDTLRNHLAMCIGERANGPTFRASITYSPLYACASCAALGDGRAHNDRIN